jgi:hypothetical protein
LGVAIFNSALGSNSSIPHHPHFEFSDFIAAFQSESDSPVDQNDALRRIGEAFNQLPACGLSTPAVADKRGYRGSRQ